MAKKKKLNAFERKFASARSGGAKEFSFGGKSYNTKVAARVKTKRSSGGGTVKKTTTATASVPTPTRRPDNSPKASTAVPKPASRIGAQIQNQADYNRRNPRQADPEIVSKFTRKTTVPKPTDKPSGTLSSNQLSYLDKARKKVTTSRMADQYAQYRPGKGAATGALGTPIQVARAAVQNERPNPKSPNAFELPNPSYLKPTAKAAVKPGSPTGPRGAMMRDLSSLGGTKMTESGTVKPTASASVKPISSVVKPVSKKSKAAMVPIPNAKPNRSGAFDRVPTPKPAQPVVTKKRKAVITRGGLNR